MQHHVSLNDFVDQFGDGLLSAVQSQLPAISQGRVSADAGEVFDGLQRQPFESQQRCVQDVYDLLYLQGERAAILNGEMGTGKTMMAICIAAMAHQLQQQNRFLVISPPHLVYKWRREIMNTVPNARVWVLNGPETLMKLITLKQSLGGAESPVPEFYILGRTRMRMGFHWKPVFVFRRLKTRTEEVPNKPVACCSSCYQPYVQMTDLGPIYLTADRQSTVKKRLFCQHCGSALWTLHHPRDDRPARADLLKKTLCKIPTIGNKTAERLIGSFGDDLLQTILDDNIYQFVNLIDDKGDFVFSDRQATRIERAMAHMEFGFGQGGYQPSEFIKRHLRGYFDLLIADEGHEYKNGSSAQGQAMGVLASQCRKALLLTGTLIGGYADDLFYLLWRILSHRMIEDGFQCQGSLTGTSMAFMREHGVLKEVITETDVRSHSTAKGTRRSVRTSRAPGFSPDGILRYVLPFTAFLKLRDLGAGALPEYTEHYINVGMTAAQEAQYRLLEAVLKAELRDARRRRDPSLMGVVLNCLLAWPDCCFRKEHVRHPRTRETIIEVAPQFDESELTPKEEALIELCLKEKAEGRRTLVYTTYTGTRDTASRLKTHLVGKGLKVAVLRASVDTKLREDWIIDQVERGIDVLVCNPELVKTGLDLFDFPTIAFMQTGYNVYTLMQASRRSWRIGQTENVKVFFLGYEETAQQLCLELIAQKISVALSTSGEIPESGLDILNGAGESIEVELARRLVS